MTKMTNSGEGKLDRVKFWQNEKESWDLFVNLETENVDTNYKKESVCEVK